jgi:hypothetical protein
MLLRPINSIASISKPRHDITVLIEFLINGGGEYMNVRMFLMKDL